MAKKPDIIPMSSFETLEALTDDIRLVAITNLSDGSLKNTLVPLAKVQQPGDVSETVQQLLARIEELESRIEKCVQTDDLGAIINTVAAPMDVSGLATKLELNAVVEQIVSVEERLDGKADTAALTGLVDTETFEKGISEKMDTTEAYEQLVSLIFPNNFRITHVNIGTDVMPEGQLIEVGFSFYLRETYLFPLAAVVINIDDEKTLKICESIADFHQALKAGKFLPDAINEGSFTFYSGELIYPKSKISLEVISNYVSEHMQAYSLMELKTQDYEIDLS